MTRASTEVPEPTSRMRREALQAPEAVAALLAADAERLALLQRLHDERAPAQWLTVARGSSDHAAAHLAFLAMTRLQLPVASVPMSVFTVHRARWALHDAWAVALSQSGRSPDLVETLQALGTAGAHTLALVNDEASPLAHAAAVCLPLHAGPEQAVAATKSFIAQLAAGVRLVALLAHDEPMRLAMQGLPEALVRAQRCDWSAALEALQAVDRLYVLGRGTGLALAQEVALKFKEVCGLQAEAYSSAEVKHGPMALVEPGYPVLVLAPPGPGQAGLLDVAEDMRRRGARVLLAAPAGTAGATLPAADGGHEALHTLALAQSSYLMIEALARARGLDPDRPRHLSKVTFTR